MHRRHILALADQRAALSRTTVARAGTGAALAIILAAQAPAPALASKVTVRVEGRAKTLLAPTSVRTTAGSLTRFGAPRGACPKASAMGAFDIATRHHWVAKWFASPPDFFITSIFGEHYGATAKYFWETFDNNVATSTGLCEVKLHPGDHILVAAVSTQGTEYPIALSAPAHATVGHHFTARVVAYTATGKARPLAGATVSVNGRRSKTANNGTVSLTPTKAGKLVLRATDAGYIRAAPVTVRVGT